MDREIDHTPAPAADEIPPQTPAMSPDEAKFVGCGLAVLLALIILFILIAGQPDDRAIEDARNRGQQAGATDGRRVGESKGFDVAYRVAFNQAYRRTVNELISTCEYHRDRGYLFGTIVGFAMMGVMSQWFLFSILRYVGILVDIDAFLYPRETAEAEIITRDTGNPEWITRLPHLAVVLLLLVPGCMASEGSAWSEGYESMRQANYQAGWDAGAECGWASGEAAGREAAKLSMRSGQAWALYSTFAICAFVGGAVSGVLSQYLTLLGCQSTGRIPEAWSILLVPGMRNSVAYKALKRKREALLWWNVELVRIAHDKNLRLAQIESLHAVATHRLTMLTSIRQLSQAKIIELVSEELATIVESSDREAAQRSNSQVAAPEDSRKHVCVCPHCRRRIQYKKRKAGATITCPYDTCGRQLRLPANV